MMQWQVSINATEVERHITVRDFADEHYRFWCESQHFARVMGHFAELIPLDEDHHHWMVPFLLGQLEWETQIVEERPANTCIGNRLRMRSFSTRGLCISFSIGGPRDGGDAPVLL